MKITIAGKQGKALLMILDYSDYPTIASNFGRQQIMYHVKYTEDMSTETFENAKKIYSGESILVALKYIQRTLERKIDVSRLPDEIQSYIQTEVTAFRRERLAKSSSNNG